MAQSADEMTKYTLDCPDDVWEAWKETVPRRINLNDGLLKLIARETLEQRADQLDAETKEQLQAIIDK